MTDLTEVRKRAWETRRKKYGPNGHSGMYRFRGDEPLTKARRMLAQLHIEGVLSEGQASAACSMSRVNFRALCDDLTQN